MSKLTPRNNPPQKDLIAHWFDKYHSDIENGIVLSPIGDSSRLPQAGRGYKFDGVDDQIVYPTNSIFSVANKLYTLYVESTPCTVNATVLGNVNPASSISYAWKLQFTSNYIRFILRGTGNVKWQLNGTFDINKFYKVCFISNGGYGENDMQLVLDGELQTLTYTDNAYQGNAGNLRLALGKANTLEGYMNPTIAEVQLFENVSLSIEEATILTTGKSIDQSPSFHLKCEDNGLISFDSSGNGNHGTKVNTDTLGANTFHYEGVDITRGYTNEEGYSDGDGTNNNGDFIPRNEADPTLDVLGNPLQYKGQVSYPAKLVESNCVSLDAVDDYVATNFTVNNIEEIDVLFYTPIEYTKDEDGAILFSYDSSTNVRYIGLGSTTTLTNSETIGIALNTATSSLYYGDDIIKIGWHNLKIIYEDNIYKVFLDNIEVQLIMAGNTSKRSWVNGWIGARPGFAGKGVFKFAYFKVKGDTNEFIYNFAEGNGTTVFDASGNGNHGTLINGASWDKQDTYRFNFENGFSLYQHNTDTVANPDIRVPLGINPAITDYTKINDVQPSQRNHNGAETKVDFNPYNAPKLDGLGVKKLQEETTSNFYQSLTKKGESLFYAENDVSKTNKILNYNKHNSNVVSDPAIWYDFDDLSTLTFNETITDQVEVVEGKGTIPNMNLSRIANQNNLVTINGRNYLDSTSGVTMSANLGSDRNDYKFLHQPDVFDKTVFFVFESMQTDNFGLFLTTYNNSDTTEIGWAVIEESRSSQNSTNKIRCISSKGARGKNVYFFQSQDNKILDNEGNLYQEVVSNGNIKINLNNEELFNAPFENPSNSGLSQILFRIGELYGKIGEVIIYDRALSSEEILEVNNYLKSKWSLN